MRSRAFSALEEEVGGDRGDCGSSGELDRGLHRRHADAVRPPPATHATPHRAPTGEKSTRKPDEEAIRRELFDA